MKTELAVTLEALRLNADSVMRKTGSQANTLLCLAEPALPSQLEKVPPCRVSVRVETDTVANPNSV